MSNKNGLRHSDYINTKKRIFTIMWISMVVVALLNIFVVILISFGVVNGYITKKMLVSLSLAEWLSTGLSIIGIAITVWLSLNIANALDKKEIENAVIKVNELEEKVGPLNTQFEPFRSSIKHAFLTEVYKTQKDLISLWLYRQFSENSQNFSSALYYELFLIEQKFSETYMLHNQPDSSINLSTIVDTTVNRIEQLLQDRSMTSDNPLILFFLRWRMEELRFYRGYCSDIDKEQAISDFEYASKKIPYLAAFLLTDPQKWAYAEHKRINLLTIDTDGDDSAKEIVAYLCNTMGEALSKLIQYDAKNNSKQKLALAYCKRSVDLHEERETYHRNYGCALERIDKTNNDFGNNKAEIIKHYTMSVQLALKNIDDPLTLQKPFRVLLSYYERSIRASLQCQMSGAYAFLFSEKSIADIDSKLLRNAVGEISDFFRYAQLSVKIVPQIALHQKLFGFACSYVCLLKKKGIDTGAIDPRDEAETLMKEAIWFLEKFCMPDDYIKDLRNREETLTAYMTE